MQESVDHRNGQNALTLTVKADIDTDEVSRRLATIANDGMAQKQIDEQQKTLQQHEEAIKRLNSQIAVATPDQTRGLLEERNVVFSDIDEMGKVHMKARARVQRELQAECPIAKKMKLYVLKGMTQSEVLKILGEPYKKGIDPDNRWYYGGSSIAFDDPRGIAENIKEIQKSMSNSEKILSEFMKKYEINRPRDERAEQLTESRQELIRKNLQEAYKVKTVHINDSCL